jgi:outer membrane protein OmpA-like peptidoglycan-associated protein
MAENWLEDVRKYAANADEGVVNAIVNYCGIALQNRDSSLVAMSDKNERDLVRENYLKKKLGLTNSDTELDDAVLAVGEVMKADRTKNRVTVYYLLAEHFGLLSAFGGVAGAVGAAAAAAAATAKVEPAPAPETAAPAYAAGNYSDDDGAGGGLGWLKWLLLAAALAALLFFLMRSCSNETATPVDDAATVEATDTAVATAIPEGAGVIAGDREGKPMLTVYFESGKSDVSNDLSTAAAKIKAYVDANAGATVAISGYNDPTGNAAQNAELSKNRAEGVAKALESIGIPATAIDLVKPEETTDTTVDKATARRVEVTIK